MTTTPTPASQQSPEAQIEQLLLGTKAQYEDAVSQSPARSDKDAERTLLTELQRAHRIINKLEKLAKHYANFAWDSEKFDLRKNERKAALAAKAQESAPSSEPDEEGISAEESIDTHDFYEMVCSYKQGGEGSTLWSDIIDHINAYTQREIALARSATAGTTTSNSPEFGGIGAGTTAARNYDCYNCNGKESAHHEGCPALRATAGNAAPTETSAIAEIKRRLKLLIGHDDALQEGYAWALAMVGFVEAEFASNAATAAPDRPDNFGQEVTRLVNEIRKPISMAWRDSLVEELIELIDPTPEGVERAATAAPGDLPSPTCVAMPAPHMRLSEEEGSDDYPVFLVAHMQDFAHRYAAQVLASNAGAAIPEAEKARTEAMEYCARICDSLFKTNGGVAFLLAAQEIREVAATPSNPPAGATQEQTK